MDRFKPTLAERERRGELRGPPWPHSSMADPALRRSLPEQPPARTQLQPRVALVVLIGAHFLSAASGATVPAQHHERGRAGCTAERAVLLRNSAAGEQPAMLARSQMCFSGVVPQPLGALGGTRNHCRHPAASTDSPPAQCRRYAQNHAFSPLAPLFPGNMARRTSLQPDSLLGLSMATKQGAGARGRGQEGRGTGAGAGSGGGKEKKPKPKRPNNGVSLSGFLADLPYGLARYAPSSPARGLWHPTYIIDYASPYSP